MAKRRVIFLSATTGIYIGNEISTPAILAYLSNFIFSVLCVGS